MAQLTTQQAAVLGSQLTGIPVAFVQALIQEEGTIGNGHNNPFDVTSDWANLTNSPALPGQDWGTQGNIASFPDTEAGVRAWAAGINTFSSYADVRSAVQYGIANDFQLLAQDFPAGYSGNSPTWAQNVVSIATSLAGGASAASQAAAAANPITQLSTGAPQVSTATLPPLAVPAIPSANDIQSAISNLGSTLTQPFVNAFNDLTAVGAFLAQPNLTNRVLLLIGGGLLFIVGLVLFAASFIRKPLA